MLEWVPGKKGHLGNYPTEIVGSLLDPGKKYGTALQYLYNGTDTFIVVDQITDILPVGEVITIQMMVVHLISIPSEEKCVHIFVKFLCYVE